MSRRLAVPTAAALSLALAASAHAAPTQTVTKVRTGPAGAKFYTPPSPLPGKKHGDLIWARTLTGAAVAPGASSTKVVLYRSTAMDDKATAVSGIVAIPKGKAPKKGWPVITYAHGTTGIADRCAPSRDVAGTPVHPYNAYILPLITRWLKAGYAVVRTDYEGLGTPGVHPYLIGTSAGRSTMDIVRAARELDPRLSKNTIISGHSQGGHAALWAAGVAAKWTPELRVRGTVAFAPASHLEDQIPLTSQLATPGGGLSGLISDIVRGLDATYPKAAVAAGLTDAAAALYPQTLDQCLPELSTPASFGGLAPKDIFKPDADLATVAKLLKANDPAILTRIKTPLRIEQGAADTTVFPVYTDQLVKDLTKNGNAVTSKSYPGVDHGGIVTAAAADATTWIAKELK
jgi:pimeloyl-ACP methyl ester carboxylesterase